MLEVGGLRVEAFRPQTSHLRHLCLKPPTSNLQR
jgi:hypothetical protein